MEVGGWKRREGKSGEGQKNGAPAWDREPRRTRFIVSVVFTPTRGVIHPSFPLRGRWERSVENRKQAPSPSLAIPAESSFETRPHRLLVQEARQSIEITLQI